MNPLLLILILLLLFGGGGFYFGGPAFGGGGLGLILVICLIIYCMGGIPHEELTAGVKRLFGEPATTRNWNTIAAIHDLLEK